MEKLLSRITIAQGVAELYREILKQQFGNDKAQRTKKNKYRTPKLNAVVCHIFQIASNIQENKKGQAHKNLNLSCMATPGGVEPPTF
ncbi:MAG: hypothetical protein ACQESZ_03520 [Bacteroidota bacterium]